MVVNGNDERLEAVIARSLAELSPYVVLRRAKQETQVCEVPEDVLKLLVKVALEPITQLTAAYADLGVHPARAKQALSYIEAEGLGRVHVLARKGRGGAPHGLEVLPKGKELLAKRGITPASKVIGRGGFAHDVYGRWLMAWASEHELSCEFECKLGEKVFDAVMRSRGGEIYGYEIVLSGSTKWNSHQAAKAAAVAGVVEVVVLAEHAKLLERLRKQLKGEVNIKNVRYAHLGEYSPF
jgi:hypothetical protein